MWVRALPRALDGRLRDSCPEDFWVVGSYASKASSYHFLIVMVILLQEISETESFRQGIRGYFPVCENNLHRKESGMKGSEFFSASAPSLSGVGGLFVRDAGERRYRYLPVCFARSRPGPGDDRTGRRRGERRTGDRPVMVDPGDVAGLRLLYLRLQDDACKILRARHVGSLAL